MAARRPSTCSHWPADRSSTTRTPAASSPSTHAPARTWGVRYHRDFVDASDEPRLRDLAPLFADGRLYVAPADTDHLLCLDPETGATVWERDGIDVVHLVGVATGRLIFTTWRPPSPRGSCSPAGCAIDAADGTDAGEVGACRRTAFGRPLLVGDLVLWPTARQPFGVFAVRQADGLQPDNPSLLYRIPSGNLVYANGVLLVADGRTLRLRSSELLADDPKEPADVALPRARPRAIGSSSR
ncbi:MAG: hypothetical protein U0736_17230 [Gemmataceae bacterium]